MEPSLAKDANRTPPQGQRLAIITRRFWPVSGASELAVGKLATSLQTAGNTVEIFTICWEKSWPSNLRFRGVPVRRLPRTTAGPWKSFRAIRHLSRHVVDFHPDGILAFGTGEEAWTAASAFADQIPLAVRIDSKSVAANRLKNTAPNRRVQLYETASAILADCQATRDRIEQLVPACSNKIQIVPDLVEAADPSQRTLAAQTAARHALSDAHPVLVTDTDQPLVVCGSPLDDDGGVIDLVRAWPTVLHQFPKARLWILGDGPAGREVWDEINELDLVYSVIMPGFFDEWSDVLMAADLYVHPRRRAGHDHHLNQALVSGICCLAGTEFQRNGTIEHNRTGLVANPEQTLDFAEAITQALADPELRQRLGRAAHTHHAPRFHPPDIMDQFMSPFRVTAAQNSLQG